MTASKCCQHALLDIKLFEIGCFSEGRPFPLVPLPGEVLVVFDVEHYT